MESPHFAPPNHSPSGTVPPADWLLDTLPWGVLVLDEDRIIRRVNQQAARWCSTSPATLLHQPLGEASLPAGMRSVLLQLLEPTDAAPREVFLPLHNLWIALSVRRQPGSWVVYGQDITAQKQTRTSRLPEYYNLFPAPAGVVRSYSRGASTLRHGSVEALPGSTRNAPTLRPFRADAPGFQGRPKNSVTDKYHALFYSMDQGFCVLEILFDDTGQQAVDFRYLELNPVFTRQSGMPEGAQGKTARELLPDLDPFWFTTYGRVARTGEAVRVEHYVPQVSRWFDVHAFRVGASQAQQVAVLFNDITTRKRAEERQAFLLHLSDALRPLHNPAAIQEVAMQLVGPHLGVNRAYYTEALADGDTLLTRNGYFNGVSSMVGSIRLSDFIPDLRETYLAGTTLVVQDVLNDLELTEASRASFEAIEFRAGIGVPLVKQGRLLAIMAVHQTTPRQWTPDEIALLEEVAERTWAAVEWANAAEELRVSEQRLRAVMENLPGGAVFVVDAELRYQVAEGRALQQMGLQPSNFLGRPVQELIPPGLWTNYQQLYQQALAGHPFEYEHEQGNRLFATRGAPLHDANGAVVAVLAVSYDITARKQAEAAVQESEEKYRTLFSSIDEGYCIIELLFDAGGQPHDWRYVEVNPAFEKNNGLANATGKTIRELAPDIEPKWFALYGEVAQSGTPVRLEEESAALGRWFSLYAFPVGKPGSHLVAVLFTDITARKQSQDALHLSEKRLHLALQAGHMGSFEWTSQGNRITLSPISEQVFGLRAGTAFLTSDAGFALVHPDDRAHRQTVFEQAGRAGTDFHSIYRIVRPLDGQVRWIEERGQGSHDHATASTCLRGVHWDVTEQVQAQRQLAEFNSKLEQRVARRTQALQASRDLLQSVFDTNLIAMSVQEAVRDEAGVVQDFRLRLVSRELERETGRTDLVGKLYAQEYPGIRETGIFDLAVRALETGEPQGMEYYYTHEGFDKWFACQFVKLGDGVVATNLDITERKTAEQERTQNLRLLEQAEAVAGLGSWDYELATGTLRWSDGMYRLFHLPLGQPVEPTIYLSQAVKEDRLQAGQCVHRIRAGTEGFEETLRLRIGEEVKTLRLKVIVLRNEAGQPVRMLGVDLDISTLQRLEADNLRLRLRQQQALFEAVQGAQEEERKRMAESLHNGIGQILYATKLRLDRLHVPVLHTAPALVAARNEADLLLGEAIRQTRALSHELVPMILQDFGLTAALQEIGHKMSTPQLRFTTQVQLDAEATPLPPPLQLALYRMAQELALNTVKHARGATTASLELETMPGWVLLRAEDNGRGFTPPLPASLGLGLRSIRDRVALLGGQLETGTAPMGGAYVRIRIPHAMHLTL